MSASDLESSLSFASFFALRCKLRSALPLDHSAALIADQIINEDMTLSWTSRWPRR